MEEIMENLSNLPIVNLNVKMIILIQEMYKNTDNETVFYRLYNNFCEEKSNFKPVETVSIKDHISSLSILTQKISNLEKINHKLNEQVNELSFDNIYRLGDTVLPKYGNTLVYNDNQDDFWILPYTYVNYKINHEKTIISDTIIGWYFSKKGWQSLFISDYQIYVNPNIYDNKFLIGNKLIFTLTSDKFIALYTKTKMIIPIYSDIEINQFSILDNSLHHSIFLYYKSAFLYYGQILYSTMVNCFDYNFTKDDLEVAIKIMNYDFKISPNHLLLPLDKTINNVFDNYEEDLIIWNNILHILNPKIPKQHSPKLLNLFSYGSQEYLKKESFEVFEVDINQLKLEFNKLSPRPVLRKLDLWIWIIKFTLNIETKPLFKSLCEILPKLRKTQVNGYFKLPKYNNENFHTVWYNVVLRNITDLSLRNKVEVISNYLINFKKTKLPNYIEELINKFVLNLFYHKKFLSLIDDINNLATYLDIQLDRHFYEEMFFLVKDQSLDVQKIKTLIFYFINNQHVLQIISYINFDQLFMYGIYEIIRKERNFSGINVNIKNGKMFWKDNGLKLQNNFYFENQTDLSINDYGNLVGWGKIKIETLNFTSNLTVFLIEDNGFKNVKENILFIFSITRSNLYVKKDIYDTFLQEFNDPLLLKFQYDKQTGLFYANKSIFEINKPFVIGGMNFYTMKNEILINSTNKDYFNNHLKIQKNNCN